MNALEVHREKKHYYPSQGCLHKKFNESMEVKNYHLEVYYGSKPCV